MPRKTKAQREAELDARSLVNVKALIEAGAEWNKFGGAHNSWKGHSFRFENVGFELQRQAGKTEFTLRVRLYLNPQFGGYEEVVEMEGLNAFPSPETLRTEIEKASDLIRPEKIVDAYRRLRRCFLPAEPEEMHRMTGYDA